MIYIIISFTVLLAMGIFLIAADRFRLPTRRSIKAIQAVERREKRKTQNIEIYITEIAIFCSRCVRLTDYNKRKLRATLKSAEIKLSPEVYTAGAWVKSGLILILIIPTVFIFPLVAPVLVLIAITVYFKELKRADELIRSKREDIEFELPRFVATLTQELKASRNVLSILESYKQNAGPSFKKELEITVADMKTGSYESALTRFEARMNSSSLSSTIVGLLGVLSGDDGVVHFQMLTHDLKLLELQRLKSRVMKRPGKIKKYSFAMMFCFLLMYLSLMFMEIMSSIEKIF